MQNFSKWCAFTCLMRQNSLFDPNSKIAFLKSAQNESGIGPCFRQCNAPQTFYNSKSNFRKGRWFFSNVVYII